MKRRYCLCGAGIQVQASEAATADLLARFEEMHSGDGHGPATARQAGSARLREEARLQAEWTRAGWE